MNRLIACSSLLALCISSAAARESSDLDTRPSIAPDIREDKIAVKAQRGDLVVVPIPISNPTLDTGLVVGAAYFYPQTEEQKLVQPASVTGVAGMYTNNDSKAAAIVQQNYWKSNTWRFTGAVGVADLRLSLLTSDSSPSGRSIDWRINGEFLFAQLSRKIVGNWYTGLVMRAVNAEQTIAAGDLEIKLGNTARSSGLGASIEFDSRDMPLNTYSGRYFKVDGLFNDEAFGSKSTYQSYTLLFRSYHELADSLVLAWEVQACQREGTTPLWDACTIKLRGFPVTDYMGKTTASAQIEARWRLNNRWGLVGFGGSGYVSNSSNQIREHEAKPSYGVGVRFMVLQAKRINMRLDFARSANSEAVYFSVGEVF